MHPRPLGPRAPSALSGESRHPRPLVRHRPRPAPRLFIFCGCISSRTRSRDPGNYSSTTDIYNYLLLDYMPLISDASANVPREVYLDFFFTHTISHSVRIVMLKRTEIIIVYFSYTLLIYRVFKKKGRIFYPHVILQEAKK